MFMVEVYERGQIVIPKHIRDMLKIAPGTTLNVNVEGNRIVLEKTNPVEELDRLRAKYAKYSSAEVDKKIAFSEKKKHDEMIKNVY